MTAGGTGQAAVAGRCGASSPLLINVGTRPPRCCLPVGHEGWHRGDPEFVQGSLIPFPGAEWTDGDGGTGTGWTSTAHSGDAPCLDCDTRQNIVWFTDSVFWNEVMRIGAGLEPWRPDIPSPILCLPCFILRAERAGFRPTGWHVSPEWPVRRVGGA